MKKFYIKIQSIVDIITNSSTEVFTVANETTIKHVYSLLQEFFEEDVHNLFNVSIKYDDYELCMLYADYLIDETDNGYDILSDMGHDNVYGLSKDQITDLYDKIIKDNEYSGVLSMEQFLNDTIFMEKLIKIDLLVEGEKEKRIAEKVSNILDSIKANYRYDG